MKVWTLFVAGIVISGVFGAVGLLAAMAPSRPDGYVLDGRLDSMTTEQLQRAISHLGLDARSYTYDISRKHVLRIDVEDYADGKLTKSERIGRHEVPYVGKQSFMIFNDTRGKDRFVISEEFLSPIGSSVSAEASLDLSTEEAPDKPKAWGRWWNDKGVLKVGEKVPLLFVVDVRHKGITFPMPVEKMTADYPRVIVVTATLESEEK